MAPTIPTRRYSLPRAATRSTSSPDDLFDIAVRRGLHFHQTREIGVVFYMLASLAENGRIGLVAIGDSAAEADALYRRTQSVLDDESKLALAPRELPAFD